MKTGECLARERLCVQERNNEPFDAEGHMMTGKDSAPVQFRSFLCLDRRAI